MYNLILLIFISVVILPKILLTFRDGQFFKRKFPLSFGLDRCITYFTTPPWSITGKWGNLLNKKVVSYFESSFSSEAKKRYQDFDIFVLMMCVHSYSLTGKSFSKRTQFGHCLPEAKDPDHSCSPPVDCTISLNPYWCRNSPIMLLRWSTL